MLEKVSVMKEDWDYLIILDSCRYDFFSDLYNNYLIGELKKVISPGSWTPEWCKESFKAKYGDVIYVSANPYINSKIEINGFNAKKHFYKIIDVWYEDWSEELGTVHPEKVNKAVKKAKDNYPGKRLIIHYLQPHLPYLSYNKNQQFKLNFDEILNDFENRQKKKILYSKRILIKNKFFNVVRYLAIHLLGIPRASKIHRRIRKLLNLQPVDPMDAVQRVVGNKGLKKLYIENLEIVLKYVSELVEDLHGTIIVTSDHGELLGEDGYYSHGVIVPRSNPFLMEIPWLKITDK